MSQNGKVWATIDGIEYVSLTKDRLDEAIQLLRKAFFPYENVCKAVGLAKRPEAVSECDDLIYMVANHGVSVVAIDKTTGKMAGISLNKLQHKNTSSQEFYQQTILIAKYPETKAIFQFLSDLEDSIDPFTPNGADCLFELLFLAVLPEYARRGIGYKLCEVSIALATALYKGENVKTSLDNNELPLEARPQIVTSLFTSFKTQAIGRKLNFDILKSISYKELFCNGRSYASVLGNETEGFTIECKKLESKVCLI